MDRLTIALHALIWSPILLSYVLNLPVLVPEVPLIIR